MKTKMSFKRAALPVVATLLTAVISLTGVTYAWFTAGTTATVDQITIGVEEADGLQIATSTADGFTWGSQYTAVDSLQNLTFSPMSGSVTTEGQIALYKATLDDNYDKITGFTTEGVNANTNYISFDMYFRNVSTTAKTININGTEVIASTGDSHRAARIAFVKQSSVTGSAASYNTSDFANGSFVSGDSQGTVAIYEPNKTSHSASGMADYIKYNSGDGAGAYAYKAIVGAGVAGAYYNRYTGDYYVKETNARTDGTYTAPGVSSNASITGGNLSDTGNGKYYLATSATNGETFAAWTVDVDYVAISAENALNQIANRAIYTRMESEGTITYSLVVNGDAITTDGTYYVCQPVEVFTKTAYDADTSAMKTVSTQGDATADTYFTLAPNTVTKVTIVIWLEGQDADCNNSTAGRPFSVALKFNATKVGE